MLKTIKKWLAENWALEKPEADTGPGGMVAVARGFNASILLAMCLGILIVASLGLFSDALNLLITACVISLLAGMHIFLLKNSYRITSILILLLLFAGVFFSMYRFGSISIAQASLLCIPILYSVLILGVRAGVALLALSIVGTAWITWAALFGHFQDPYPTIPQAQWVIFTVGLVIAFRLAVLFKQHLVDANIRINAQQKRLLQERYLQNSELEVARMAAQAANQAKSDFLAVMSHEIRTPMNGVIGMLEVLRSTPLNNDQRRIVETIHQSSELLLYILNDVLDFSKIEAGQMDLERIPIEIRELVAGVGQLMRHAATLKGIEFTTDVQADLPLAILGDPVRLNQVLLNLLGNALKFTPSCEDSAGKVLLTVSALALPGGEPGITFKVTDNGIGISAQDLGRLFEPFVQTDASTTRKFGGTGLGLSISRQLVEKMGGRLLVQSTLSQGSQFIVHLPLSVATLPDSSRKAKLDAPSSTQLMPSIDAEGSISQGFRQAKDERLILLVDDNETNQEVMHEQLRILGYRCELASNGNQALAKWRSGRFSLILTDCRMPEMDGFELTTQIRSLEAAHEHTPIVAVTANALKGEAKRCLDSGMDDYLTKPLRLLELAAMVSKWLPGSAHLGHESNSLVWDASVLPMMVGEDQSMIKRLLERFLLNSEKQVNDLVLACNAQNWIVMVDVGHKLKSACLTVGAIQLGQTCAQIEAAAKDQDAKACAVAANAIQMAFGAVQESIQDQLSVQTASADRYK